MISLLMVDEVRLMCNVFEMALKSEPDFEVVGCATNVEEALKQVHKANVVLVSTTLPDDGAYQLTRAVLKAFEWSGYRTEITWPHFLAKALHGDVFTDFDIQVRPGGAPTAEYTRRANGRFRLNVGIGAGFDDVEYVFAEAIPDVITYRLGRRRAKFYRSVLDGVVQHGGDRLVFRSSVLKGNRRNTEQVGQVRYAGAFPKLCSVHVCCK